MIEFVTLENAHLFPENPLLGQHQLRYRSTVKRQGWDVPSHNQMEFDQYDCPATKYLIYRDKDYITRGVSRFYPTSLPYMLEQVFPHFVTNMDMPKDPKVWEGSRFCVDETLPPDIRRKIVHELVVGYLEMSMRFGVKAIVGLMYPAYWRRLFISSGWEIEFMGEVTLLRDGNKARSAWLPVSHEILSNVRNVTNIKENIVNFGDCNEYNAEKSA